MIFVLGTVFGSLFTSGVWMYIANREENGINNFLNDISKAD